VKCGDRAARTRYNDNHHNYLKPMHNIGFGGDGASESWNKDYRGPPQQTHSRTFDQRSPQNNQRGRASNRGWGRGRGPYMPRPLYCMYHGNETDHRTKDCPIYIDTKQKMNQDTTQPSPQLQSKEINHTMQWAPHNKHHSPPYPLHYPAQAYQNSQAQLPAYYQSYHYATTNHLQPLPAPQITYIPALPQITYPMLSNTNANRVKAEPNPPLPPPPQQAQEPPQQTENFPTHGTILTITRGSNTDIDTKR
jgi:hypothetical protein